MLRSTLQIFSPVFSPHRSQIAKYARYIIISFTSISIPVAPQVFQRHFDFRATTPIVYLPDLKICAYRKTDTKRFRGDGKEGE